MSPQTATLQMKPYRQVPIQECGEPLVAIPLSLFAVETPHPYIKCGADYAGKSPYYLRQGVLDRLILAQERLQQLQPGWKIKLYDAYRPVEVQQFMVEYTFHQALADRGLDAATLTVADADRVWQDVYQVWAITSFDIDKPTPHSTGAAVDLTLADEQGVEVAMGSPIDEMSTRSHPNYFGNASDPIEQQYHQHRQLLDRVMTYTGFVRHPEEWWHFSIGDQLWAWVNNQTDRQQPLQAYYGRAL